MWSVTWQNKKIQPLDILTSYFTWIIFCILLIQVQKRLKNEPGICCVAITNNASRIAFGILKCNKYGRLVDSYSSMVVRGWILDIRRHWSAQLLFLNIESKCWFGLTIWFNLLFRLKVWEPFRRKHKTILGYGSLKLNVSSRLHIIQGGAKAILLAGIIMH